MIFEKVIKLLMKKDKREKYLLMNMSKEFKKDFNKNMGDEKVYYVV